MPYKDKEKLRDYRAKEQARRRARHPERFAALDARRTADLRAVILAEKLIRGKCSNQDCLLGGLAVTPENSVIFDFDHRDRSEKRDMVGRLRSRATIEAEMAKCDLLCAICHRLKTHRAGEHMPLLAGYDTAKYPTLFDE